MITTTETSNTIAPSRPKVAHDDNLAVRPDRRIGLNAGRVGPQKFECPLKEIAHLRVEDIRVDPGIQVRATMDSEAIEEYAEKMKQGITFPAVVVVANGETRWLADGFHRLEATKLAGLETIAAEIMDGGRADAIKHALGANVSHGIRRTNADKRRAAEIALKEFSELSDRNIAELCGVGNALVGEVRQQLFDSNTSKSRKGRDGKQYKANKAKRTKEPKEVRNAKVDSTTSSSTSTPPEEPRKSESSGIAAGADPEAGYHPEADARENMVPAEMVEQAVASITLRDLSDSADSGMVDLVRHLVPAVADMLDQLAQAYTNFSGRELSQALGISNIKLQTATQWC